MTKTVASYFGLEPPNVKTYSKALPLACSDPSLLYGVELEIEFTEGQDWVVPGMRGEADGSLRNGGYEYITYPMTFSNLAYCLQMFFKKSNVGIGNYSERCSVHVHVNCQDLTMSQVSTVLMLYQVFEKALFGFIGNDRDKNIFCVPWSETTLTYGVVKRMFEGNMDVRQWQKYTAVNLIPLRSQGTLEFRHMAGTCDQVRILAWCNLIGCLFNYARKNEFEDVKTEITELNTNSFYRRFLDKVFREWFYLLVTPQLNEQLEDGVLQMKYALLYGKLPIKAKIPDRNEAWVGEVLAAAGGGIGQWAPRPFNGPGVAQDLNEQELANMLVEDGVNIVRPEAILPPPRRPVNPRARRPLRVDPQPPFDPRFFEDNPFVQQNRGEVIRAPQDDLEEGAA